MTKEKETIEECCVVCEKCMFGIAKQIDESKQEGAKEEREKNKHAIGEIKKKIKEEIEKHPNVYLTHTTVMGIVNKIIDDEVGEDLVK